MFFLQQLFSLIKILNSDRGETSVAAGLSFGMILGFVPANPVIIIGLLFIFCLFRMHGGSLFLGWAVFSILAFFLDPLFDSFGYWILTQVEGRPLYTQLYNFPIVPWTRFNNSIVAGSLAVGILAYVPVLFLSRALVRKYRDTVLRRIKETKLFKLLKTTALYKLYDKYERVKGTVS